MKRFEVQFFLLAITTAFSLTLMAQPGYVFHHLTTEEGLSNSSANAIIKDSYGFLWIGTASGLSRYDGYEFKNYYAKPGQPGAMATNNIFGLQEDGLGSIWISSNPNMVYNRSKDNFITDVSGFLNEFGIVVGRNYKIYVDREKDLWVLSDRKVFFYNTSDSELRIFNIETHFDEILSAELSDDGNSLYGILKPGLLWEIDKRTGAQSTIALEDVDNSELYNNVYADGSGGIWLFSSSIDQICYRKNFGTDWKRLQLRSPAKFQRNPVIKNIREDGNGRMWIGTDHSGLFIYDTANELFVNALEDPRNSASIGSNNINCLYKDGDGVMWIGHGKKGISYYHSSFHTVINIEHPECRDVITMMEDQWGNLWLGTDGNGLFVREHGKDGLIKKQPLPISVIVSLVEDRKGRIWIGTYRDGLYCYEDGKFSHFTSKNSSLASNNIWNVERDRYENLWIGTLAGGIQYLPSENGSMKALVNVCEEMKHPMDMHYDGGDNLFIGTVYGLYTVDIVTGNYVVHTGNRKGTQNFDELLIHNVFRDSNDNIWMGHLNGLTLWDMKQDTVYYINKESGLTDNIVHGVIEDNHNNIWVSTSNGLSLISISRDRQDVMDIVTRNFSTKDGFKNNYFNNRAIYQLRNGDILLGGTEGYVIVNPNKIAEKNQQSAQVLFTGLNVGGHKILVDSLYGGHKFLSHPMEQTDALMFRHDDKLISLTFTTGDLLHADKVKYAYKVEGFDDQWILTSDNKVNFSSLPSGHYKFMVKACNSDGLWGKDVSMLKIVVTPPIYLSTWALTIYVLLAIGALFLIGYIVRRRHEEKLKQQRIEIEQIQKANLNELKMRFFTNISHDLRTPLTLIITPLQAILDSELSEILRKKLQTMNRNAEQLLQLINSLLDFRKLDAGAEALHLDQGDFIEFVREICVPFQAHAADRSIEFTFINDVDNLFMQFDTDKIRKIILNLLSNAFKFTPDQGGIKMHIFTEKDNVCLKVMDSGEGIDEDDKKHIFEQFFQSTHKPERTGSGIGLHIVSEYVTILGGTISVTNNVPKGSIFFVQFPIIPVEDGQEIQLIENTPPNETLDELPSENMANHDELAQPVLLFVDDNREFCEFMSESLSDEYIVVVAHTGEEALERLHENDVNVVVSDIMMPVMSGTELCNQIKTNIQWSHIPVILLTARSSDEYRIEGLEMGADDYITKPLNLSVLRLRIRKFLEWTEKSHVSFGQKMDISPSEITITPLDEKLIEKAIKVVEEHMSDSEFSVEDLGSAVGLSRSHLYKKLMGITGRGPAEFIRIIRLKRSKQLLAESQLQIAEIAYAVGFNSPKRFTINFRHEFGMSPSQYIKEVRGLTDQL